MTTRIGIVILAAGASTRMGTPKQVLPWNNSTLLEHCIKQATSLGFPVTVVLGAHEAEIRNKVNFFAARTAINRDWMEGMGSSIAAGIRHITSQESAPEAVLIMLGDQPFVDKEYLDSLITAYMQKGKGIVATDYGESFGVPAVFGREYFQNLLALTGLYGARELMESHSKHITAIKGGEKTTDLDYPGDYRRYRQQGAE